MSIYLELWYLIWVFSVTRPFWGCLFFYFVTLTWELSVLFENRNPVHNFWTVNFRALIFNIPYDKIFLLVLLTMIIDFCLNWHCSLNNAQSIFVTWPFYWYQDFVLVTLAIFRFNPYRGHMCFTNTSCFSRDSPGYHTSITSNTTSTYSVTT